MKALSYEEKRELQKQANELRYEACKIAAEVARGLYDEARAEDLTGLAKRLAERLEEINDG